VKAAVVVFPGSNCDRDTAVALRQAGAEVTMVWHAETTLPKVDLVVLPGGFAYGDYLRSGAMAAVTSVMRPVIEHAKAGRLVLGICNGFQVLTETRLLPGTMLANASLKFICRDVHLRVERTDLPFTRNYQVGQSIRVPLANHDGQYFADAATLARLEGEGQVVFRYIEGETWGPYNPNGSINDIAGICNAKGNVLGLMPHPERVSDARHGGTDGKALFAGLAALLEAA
jgi:phosphoribosylformylglycinamidine synthase